MSRPRPLPEAPSASQLATWVRAEVAELEAYSLLALDERQPVVHHLDQNEMPWDLPRALKREALARLAAADWSKYPDMHADSLRAQIGARHGLPAEAVLIGTGSGELLATALDCFAGAEREVLCYEPSFAIYPMLARRTSTRLVTIPPRADLRLPLAELEREIERDPGRPVILCSPNNPTGDAATPEHVERLLERLEAPLLLDNAYGEFCRHDYRPLLERHAHLVLFRTLSKAWSLAGARIGYVLAHPALVRELLKIKLPYNLSQAAATFARVALEQPRWSERAVRVIVGRREQWLELLCRYGLETFESEGNFVLVRTATADRLRTALAERGVTVRQVGHYPGLAGCLRFGIGSGPALRAVKGVLAELATEQRQRQSAEEGPTGESSTPELPTPNTPTPETADA